MNLRVPGINMEVILLYKHSMIIQSFKTSKIK